MKSEPYVTFKNEVCSRIKNEEKRKKEIENKILIYWDKTAEWGSYVHNSIERWLLYDIELESTDKFYKDWKGALNYLILLVGFKLVYSEVPVVYPDLVVKDDFLIMGGLGGTIDALLYNEVTGKYIILDFKRTNKVDKKKIIKWKIQIALYYIMLELRYKESLKFDCDEGVILQLYSDFEFPKGQLKDFPIKFNGKVISVTPH